LGLGDQEEEVFNSLSIERLKVLIDSAAHAFSVDNELMFPGATQKEK
jgi:hypothetical protein